MNKEVSNLYLGKKSQIEPQIRFMMHGSILTKKGNEGLVESGMRQELHNLIGYNPSVGLRV